MFIIAFLLFLVASVEAAPGPGSTNAPTITHQPQSQIGTPGGTVTFTVTATNALPLTYQWEFNGTSITNATNSSLVITNVQFSDSGVYQVIVSNSNGSVTSSMATLGIPITLPKGTYTGIFTNSGTLNPGTSGSFSLTLSKDGGFTAGVQIGPTKYSGRSQLDSFAVGAFVVTSSRGIGLSVVIQPNPQDTNSIFATIWSETWPAEICIATRSTFNKRTNPMPLNPQYTMVMEPIMDSTNGSAAVPDGAGTATVKIDKAGKIRFSGSLADGVKFSGSAKLNESLRWPCYISASRGRETVVGDLVFTNAAGTNLSGTVLWSRATNTHSATYTDGFLLTNDVFGTIYTKPALGQPAITNHATLILAGGPLSTPFTNAVTIDEHNRLSFSSGEGLAGSISRSTGLMKAKLSAASPISIQGAVLQDTGTIEGFFLQNGLSGTATIVP